MHDRISINSASINQYVDRSKLMHALDPEGHSARLSGARIESTMWRIGGCGSSLSQLLRRQVAASALSQSRPHQAARFSAAAAAGFDHAFGSPFANSSENVPWLQQRAVISMAGDGAESHDDFKPVQKGGSSVPSVREHIEKDIKENAVLVYMKGVPEAPQCGFSAMVIRILDDSGVQYKTRNVLTDPELRNAIKQYSKWPTIPQVYVNGKFVGGSDILISMHRSGELETVLKDVKKQR